MFHRKDFFYEGRDGTMRYPSQPLPLGRTERARTIGVRYQGGHNACVAKSLEWIAEWCGRDGSKVFTPEEYARINAYGIAPRKALEAYRKAGVFPNWVWLRRLDAETVRSALALSPMIVGVDGFLAKGMPHAMVLLEALTDGWLLVNWNDPTETDFVTLPYDSTSFTFAAAVADFSRVPKHRLRLSAWDWLKENAKLCLARFQTTRHC
jgi:hypothetical protein